MLAMLYIKSDCGKLVDFPHQFTPKRGLQLQTAVIYYILNFIKDLNMLSDNTLQTCQGLLNCNILPKLQTWHCYFSSFLVCFFLKKIIRVNTQKTGIQRRAIFKTINVRLAHYCLD